MDLLFSDSVEVVEKYLESHPDDIDKFHINGIYTHEAGGTYERTPLIHAVRERRVDIIDLLIKHKCNVNKQDANGYTALHHALMRHLCIDRTIVERLISSGASGVIQDRLGRTPLQFVVPFVSDINIIHLLIPISDPNSLDCCGKNSLMDACYTNTNPEIISALIDVTSDINLQSTTGRTSLYYACVRNNDKAIKLLVERDAINQGD